jgi:hypothetical protein
MSEQVPKPPTELTDEQLDQRLSTNIAMCAGVELVALVLKPDYPRIVVWTEGHVNHWPVRILGGKVEVPGLRNVLLARLPAKEGDLAATYTAKFYMDELLTVREVRDKLRLAYHDLMQIPERTSAELALERTLEVKPGGTTGPVEVKNT